MAPPNQSHEALLRRQRKATSAFWALKAVLLNRDLPPDARRKVFRERVTPVFTHGSSPWVLSKRNVESLYRWENQRLPETFRVGRQPAEEWKAHAKRHAKLARESFHQTQPPSLRTVARENFQLMLKQLLRFWCAVLVAQNSVAWPGADFWQRLMAAKPDTPPTVCLTDIIFVRCLLWRGREWRGVRQSVYATVDPQNKESWKHDRPGPNSGTETPCAKTAGDRWKRTASSSAELGRHSFFEKEVTRQYRVILPDLRCGAQASQPARCLQETAPPRETKN